MDKFKVFMSSKFPLLDLRTFSKDTLLFIYRVYVPDINKPPN